jgi:hypothetical protein
MSSITVSSLVLGSLTVEVDGSDSTLALSVLGTAPATLSIELGTPGAQGNAATIAVGTTTTLSPGSAATVANVGTTSAAVFNFGIPSGLTGATGPGVPVGGTDGQVLAKIDTTDYNTQWATAFALQVRNQVRNETGATLTKGTVVYVTGASGNKVTVSKALATGDATSAQTFAVLLENIPNNQNGYAVTSGLLENLDTSAYAAGTQVYLSPTTAGTFTPTKPSAPDHLVYVGVIERSHVNQGTMLVRIQNGYELEELHNVAIAGLANNDLLAYDSATTLWKNKTFGTLGLLTSATAASTYYLQTNPAGYIDATALAPYLTIASAAGTYQTIAGMSSYLTTSAAASTYLAKASNLSDLANAATARTNLGLGTAAVEPATKLVPAGGTTGQVLSKVSASDWDLTWATAGGAGSDVQAYKTPGTFTWTKPAGAKAVFVFVSAGGGGGGGGAVSGTNGARGGGGAGGGGGFTQIWMNAADLPSTVTVTVGAGGAGGASRPAGTTSSGLIGSPGGATSFGSFVRAAPGAAGNQGTIASGGTAGGGASVSLFCFTGLTVLGGGNGATTNGSAGGDTSTFQPLPAQNGGGGAGAAANVTTAANGGAGGGKLYNSSQSGTTVAMTGGAGGIGSTATPAVAGTTTYAFGWCGTGGGGGFYRTATNGGTGGVGGSPSGGGGGGGGSDVSNASGAGGNGGPGYCLVITTL